MSSYEATITIAAPQETVWRILSGVAQWPDWLPTVSAVEPQTGATLALDARYRVLQPKLRPALWRVTQLDPPHQFTWVSGGPGYAVTAEHILAAAAPECVAVRLRISFSGLFGPLFGWLNRSLTQSYLEQEATALKHTAEAAS